jgi:hypothetical protein
MAAFSEEAGKTVDNNDNPYTIDQKKKKTVHPFTPGWKGKRRWMGNVPGRRLSRATIRKLYELRDMRMRRLPPRQIMHDLEITSAAYYQLMYYIEVEDAELLALENKNRLQSEIALYEETAGEIIAANLEIVRDRNVEAQDRQESSRIALDAAMTVVKIHTEGPRIIKEAYAPIASYLAVQNQPMPLPDGQKHREKELLDKSKTTQQQQQQQETKSDNTT